jgi:hypothetical protein
MFFLATQRVRKKRAYFTGVCAPEFFSPHGIMDRMKYRKLRIAWSVAWGVVAVLLRVLWVRSYSKVDLIYFGRNYGVISNLGVVRTVMVSTTPSTQVPFLSSSKEPGRSMRQPNTFLGFHISGLKNHPQIRIPYWFTVLSAAMIAVAPWLQSRFSLRTLLTATTLFALGLGLIVWVSRK